MKRRTVLVIGSALAIGLAVFTGAGSASGAAVPRNVSAPTIRGNAQYGQLLQADYGRWQSSSTVDYSYQWRRCLADGTGCIDIPKATDRIYAARADDVGHTLRVAVTATNRDGAGSASSSATAAVLTLPAEAPHNTAAAAIAGSTRPGEVLTANPGSWTGADPIGFSYLWRRCNTTGGDCRRTSVRKRTYKVSDEDAKHSLRVLVTATNGAGSSSFLSDPTASVSAPVRASAPASTSPPTISGTARAGEPLTGDRGAWSNNPTGYDYSWRRCDSTGDRCSDIGGAHGTTYTPTSADVGHALRFKVKAKNAVGATTASSAPTRLIAAATTPLPASTSTPRISGTARQGQQLTGDRGNWANAPTGYEYSWLRCDGIGNNCSDIGEHGTTYTLGSGDIGHTIRFSVKARNAGGSTTSISSPTGVVVAAAKPPAPVNTSPPKIAGTAQDGKTLTGDRGTWSNSPTGYDYSWRRCNTRGDECDGIDGAHGTTYTSSATDVGHTIRFKVTAKNAGGSTTATSSPTAPVRTSDKPGNTSPPTIAGTPQEGKTLTADRGSWTHNPTGYDYAWLRCDRSGGSCAAIGGAHGTTYTLTSADVASTLRFRVTAANTEGGTTATSVPTGVIQKAISPPPPPPPPPPANGCPPGGNPDRVAGITPPARLLVDTLVSDPRVVSRGTFTLVVRFHVSSTCGGPVQGALVYATATPFNQFSIPPEATTGTDGWATLIFRRLRGFPVSPRQQLIAMFVRARKPGENLLGGISTRRLVSVPVKLH